MPWRERQIQVVGEVRLPVRVGQLRVLHLREQEVRVGAHGGGAGGRATSVEFQVHQRERQYVGQPDRRARNQQLCRPAS
jgi:hypothetical protein